jgi:hypothetical protein
VVEEFEGREEIDTRLNKAEIKWIAFHKEKGCPLLNCTPGGEGTVGWKHRPETKEKLRQAWEERKQRPIPGLARQRMSESGKKRWARDVPRWSITVRCIEDDIVFPSAKHAASHYGTYNVAILRECRGNTFLKRTIGKSFEFIKPSTPQL